MDLVDHLDVNKITTTTTINVGNPVSPGGADTRSIPVISDDLDSSVITPLALNEIIQKEVYMVVKDINTSKSSGLENMSSYIIKEAFKILLPEVFFFFFFFLFNVNDSYSVQTSALHRRSSGVSASLNDL